MRAPRYVPDGRPATRSNVVAVGAVVLGALAFVGFRLDARAAAEPTFELAGEGAERCVVLLHGLARTSASMARLGERLRETGYATVNVDYPSRKFPVSAVRESRLHQPDREGGTNDGAGDRERRGRTGATARGRQRRDVACATCRAVPPGFGGAIRAFAAARRPS